MTDTVPAVHAGAARDPHEEILRLQKVVRVLMDRVERSTRLQGSDFDTFQMTLMLEDQVRERTASLEAALAENEKIRIRLEHMAQRLQTSEAELRLHRDHLSELVTEQTADLLAAKETAENARTLQREFLLNMSHELRTPLHAIYSYAQIGQDRAGTATPAKIADYFLHIQQSGSRLCALVEKLLDLSALDAGRFHLHVRPTSLGDLIAAVEAEQIPAMQARNVRIEHSFLCQDTIADVDPEFLRKALRPIYANAIKYSPAGGCIEVRLREEIPAGNGAEAVLVLSICDQGPGIPAGEEETIFEKFVQSSATKSGAGGAGVGLSIVREIIRLHGGQVRVRNRKGAGAEFEMVLPRHSVTTAAV